MFCPRCTIDHPPELCPLNPQVQQQVQQVQTQMQTSTAPVDAKTATDFFGSLVDLAVDVATAIPKKADEAVKAVGECVGSAYDAGCDAASSAVEAVGDAAGAVADGAGAVIEAAGDAISAIADI